MICLDTNVAIGALTGRPPALRERFDRELPGGGLALSTVALFELCYGLANSARRAENAERLRIFLEAPITLLPLDADDAAEAGEIRAHLRRAGTPIGPYDLLTAAQARRRGALLVTARTAEFTRVPGLRTEDWTAG